MNIASAPATANAGPEPAAPAPDVASSEAKAVDAKAGDAKAVDAGASDTKASDTKAPDTKADETQPHDARSYWQRGIAAYRGGDLRARSPTSIRRSGSIEILRRPTSIAASRSTACTRSTAPSPTSPGQSVSGRSTRPGPPCRRRRRHRLRRRGINLAAPSRRHRKSLRQRDALVARDLAQDIGAVGDDAVDAGVDQAGDVLCPVDGPDHDFEPEPWDSAIRSGMTSPK